MACTLCCVQIGALGKPTKLDDLKGIDPALAHGLGQLLAYDKPDAEEVFLRNFSVEYEEFGANQVSEWLTVL